MIILHVSYTLKDPRQRSFFCAAFPADREEEAFLLEICDDPVSMAAHKATKKFYRLQELKTGYVLATAVKKYELPGIAH